MLRLVGLPTRWMSLLGWLPLISSCLLHAHSDVLISLFSSCQIPTIIFSVSHDFQPLICQIDIIASET
jgi:hypothetical protein